MAGERDIGTLRDDVEYNVRQWLTRCEALGLPVLITDTLRTQAAQTALYAQGRTESGNIVTNAPRVSFHGAGLALDFCKNVKGEEYSDRAFFLAAIREAKAAGFSSGIDWENFPELPHLQWDMGGAFSDSDILAGRLPPTMPPYRFGEENEVRYRTLEDIRGEATYYTVISQLITAELIRGRNDGTLDLSEDMIRILVVNYRAGIYDAALQSAGIQRKQEL